MSEDRARVKRNTAKVKLSDAATENEIDQVINRSVTPAKLSHDEFSPYLLHNIQVPSPKSIKLDALQPSLRSRLNSSSTTTTCYHFENKQGDAIYLPKKLLTHDQQDELKILIQEKISTNKKDLEKRVQKSAESRQVLQKRIPEVERQQQLHTSYTARKPRSKKSTATKHTRNDEPIGTPSDTHSMYKFTVPLYPVVESHAQEEPVPQERVAPVDIFAPVQKKQKQSIWCVVRKKRTILTFYTNINLATKVEINEANPTGINF
jgi:hypothetical protein